MIETIKSWLSVYRRKRQAAKYDVPFRERMWYNFRAMLSKKELANYSFIEIFDKNGRYVDCPRIGGEVIYNHKSQRFKYLIIGFKNEPRNRDWLYDTDYINPVVEFLEKIED